MYLDTKKQSQAPAHAIPSINQSINKSISLYFNVDVCIDTYSTYLVDVSPDSMTLVPGPTVHGLGTSHAVNPFQQWTNTFAHPRSPEFSLCR